MTRLAITGIGEGVGLRMAERALERGLSVRGLADTPESRRRAERTGAKVLEGDVRDGRLLERVLMGADVVLHAAEQVEAGAIQWEDRFNVRATRCVARAAREAGAKQFVHVSSARVYGPRCPDAVTEEGPFSCDGDPYAYAKLKSEVEAWCQHLPKGMGVTIIRPGYVYGYPGDSSLLQALQSLLRGESTLPERGTRAVNHLHIDNLVDALELVIEKRVAGEVLNISDGTTTTMHAFYAALAQTLSEREIAANTSWFDALRRGIRSALLQRRSSLPPSANVAHARGYLNIERARRVLGYEPRIGLAQGLFMLVETLQTEGTPRVQRPATALEAGPSATQVTP